MFAVSAIFVYVLIEYLVLPAHHTILIKGTHTMVQLYSSKLNLLHKPHNMTLSELHRPESGNWNMNDASNEK